MRSPPKKSPGSGTPGDTETQKRRLTSKGIAQTSPGVKEMLAMTAESGKTTLESLRKNAPDLEFQRREEKAEELRVARMNLESVLRHLTPESPKVTPAQMVRNYVELVADFELARLLFAAEAIALLIEEKRKLFNRAARPVAHQQHRKETHQ
jgi:hypothetical protein